MLYSIRTNVSVHEQATKFYRMTSIVEALLDDNGNRKEKPLLSILSWGPYRPPNNSLGYGSHKVATPEEATRQVNSKKKRGYTSWAWSELTDARLSKDELLEEVDRLYHNSAFADEIKKSLMKLKEFHEESDDEIAILTSESDSRELCSESWGSW